MKAPSSTRLPGMRPSQTLTFRCARHNLTVVMQTREPDVEPFPLCRRNGIECPVGGERLRALEGTV
jgi:hypothetical protein